MALFHLLSVQAKMIRHLITTLLAERHILLIVIVMWRALDQDRDPLTLADFIIRILKRSSTV
jgi:hypothetical protein